MQAKDRDEFRSEFHVKLECRVVNHYFVTDGRTLQAWWLKVSRFLRRSKSCSLWSVLICFCSSVIIAVLL